MNGRSFIGCRPSSPAGLVNQIDYDWTRLMLKGFDQVAMIIRAREFDRHDREFMARHESAVVVHIGCGLDTRFERVDNGLVEWYDLDLPDVIELRRKLVGGEGTRHHFMPCSVLESAWLDEIGAKMPRPVLFVAEGVFMYLTETQVKSLVLTLHDRFPGAELVFDAFSPFLRWAHNFKVTRTRVGAYLHWALKHGRDLEEWSSGIRLLDEQFPFQAPEPRIRRALKMHLFPLLATGIGIYHYRL